MSYLLHESPKFLNNVFLFASLKNLGTFTKFLLFFFKLSVQTFQPIIVITRGTFVCQIWICT